MRQADSDLYAWLQQGEFCYVLTARQMGKSSLMVRTAGRLREQGVAVAVLDLTAIGQNVTAEQWCGGILERIGVRLELEDELEEFWLSQGRLGPLQRLMTALRRVVLTRCPGRIVIFVDEIDAVRSLPFSTDEFFAGIRECYNRRAEDPEFERLTFCLLGVASPSDLIRDTRTTPFNIGRRVEPGDFTEAEARPACGRGARFRAPRAAWVPPPERSEAFRAAAVRGSRPAAPCPLLDRRPSLSDAAALPGRGGGPFLRSLSGEPGSPDRWRSPPSCLALSGGGSGLPAALPHAGDAGVEQQPAVCRGSAAAERGGPDGPARPVRASASASAGAR